MGVDETTVKTFQELLRRHEEAQDPATRAAVEAELWSTYGVEEAVLVLDMAGFSLLTLRHGVVHYLSMVRRMQRVVRPIVERNGGWVVKFEADNSFARFSGVRPAVQAAVEMHRAFACLNPLRDAETSIEVSIGIDYGRFLLVDDRDLFGNPVNLASKLGEDVARHGEILITAAAVEAAEGLPGVAIEPAPCTVSGIAVRAFRIHW
jgi:adenylate cyclase